MKGIPRLRRRAWLLGAAFVIASAGMAQAQTRYIAFGDSITEGVGDNPLIPAEERGYPFRLENLLNDSGAQATVENAGLGGERTPEGVTRIDSVLAGGGDVLLLMEGTNDISRSISPETTLANLQEMARKAENRGMEVYQATLIPRLPNARFDSDNFLNQVLVQEIRRQAGNRQRGLVDPFAIFSSLDDLYAQYYWDDPSDPVGHPNPDGYDRLAAIFFDLLTDVDSVPPVPGAISPENGARQVPASGSVEVELWDFGSGIDLANTTLLVNGVDTNVVPSGDASRADLSYSPPQPLSGVVSVTLRSQDQSVPPNTVDQEIARFVVAGTAFLDGDFDEDGRVDGADLVFFGRLFGLRRNDRDYRAAADFNGDGLIDGVDLATFATNFGQSSF